MKIGVLRVQGAVREHADALEKCGVEVAYVKYKEQFDWLDGLVLPGGESTTIGKLISRCDLIAPIKELVRQGKPVYGTCAGLILLAREVYNSDQMLLREMDITVSRNAFGRQRDSFECDLEIPVLGDRPFKAVFIRAPKIIRCGCAVEVLARCQGEVVLARQGNILVSSFHPELTPDERLHCYFAGMVKQYMENRL